VSDAGNGLPGVAHLVLVPGVGLLQPERPVLEATVVGWERQQRFRFLEGEGGPRTAKPQRQQPNIVRSGRMRHALRCEVPAERT
jgi:hypothetical protein